MELISVIVPVYKVEDYLDKCVQSIVDQTYEKLEIILVDDGSPDACGSICDAWAQMDSRIRVVHKENGGLSDARNAGMEVATGEYIAFVDSDDWVTADFLDKLYAALQQDNSDIAACGVQMVWEDDTPSCMLTHDFNGVLTRDEAQEALLEESHLLQPVWYKLYRRKVVEGIPFQVGKYHEDAFWSYQVIGRAQKVSVCSDVGYFYLQRGGSIMGEAYSLRRLDAVEAACERQEYLHENFSQLTDKATVQLAGLLLYHGQKAVSWFEKHERKQVIRQLKNIRKQYPITFTMLKPLKASHKVWMLLSRISFTGTCMLRNWLGVGV